MNQPRKSNGKSHLYAFTLIEIMIIIAIIGLLAAIAIPSLKQARDRAQTRTCIQNLRVINSAKKEWALEGKVTDTLAVATGSDLQRYIVRDSDLRLPVCPLDPAATFKTSYSVGALKTTPTCMVSPTNHVLN